MRDAANAALGGARAVRSELEGGRVGEGLVSRVRLALSHQQCWKAGPCHRAFVPSQIARRKRSFGKLVVDLFERELPDILAVARNMDLHNGVLVTERRQQCKPFVHRLAMDGE